MSDVTPEPISDLDQQRLAGAAAGVFAAAAALVARAEAEIVRERMDAANIAAATAWASVPVDAAHIFDVERVAWLEAACASEQTVDHQELARRSVLAATVAAEALADALGQEEYATSDLMSEGIAAIVAAYRAGQLAPAVAVRANDAA